MEFNSKKKSNKRRKKIESEEASKIGCVSLIKDTRNDVLTLGSLFVSFSYIQCVYFLISHSPCHLGFSNRNTCKLSICHILFRAVRPLSHLTHDTQWKCLEIGQVLNVNLLLFFFCNSSTTRTSLPEHKNQFK